MILCPNRFILSQLNVDVIVVFVVVVVIVDKDVAAIDVVFEIKWQNLTKSVLYVLRCSQVG